METGTALLTRRGIRVYSERAVDESCLRSIVEAGAFMRRGEILKHEAEVRALCGAPDNFRLSAELSLSWPTKEGVYAQRDSLDKVIFFCR